MSAARQYSDRLERRTSTHSRLNVVSERLGIVRLVLTAVILALGWICSTRGLAWGWLLLPAGLFAATVLYHQRIRGLQALAQRGGLFYRSGLDRLQGVVVKGQASGDQFADEHHLYGGDLDLFGSHGLYQRLCTARTSMGEARLASWLLEPSDLATINVRQTSIRELRERIDFREDLAILGEPARISLQAGALGAWAEGNDALPRGRLAITAALLTASAGATAVLWSVSGLEFPFLAVLVIEASLAYVFRTRIQAAMAGIEHAYQDLRLLALILRRIEGETFDSPSLTALKGRLSTDSTTSSVTLSKLATLVNFVEARRNPMLAPLMLPAMYTIQSALAAERWRRRHGKAVAAWLEVIAEFEALNSLAAYSLERPKDTFPEFIDGPAAFVASQLGHPLIAADSCVRNDVDLSGGTRVLLVSGSNMSGKSTLLRAVGVNTVLAMAGAPVCATRLRLTPLKVGASIRVNDSLFEGSSRFYSEITRLRQLFEPASLPLLFLLDELLQGTNSTDRRIGAQGVVRALLGRGGIGLVSTHDLSLTEGDSLAGMFKNVHFQDELVGGKLRFDFKLREGVVTKSNGVELMRAIGLEV